MKYAIIIEQTETNYSAYVPDLPGCIATGATLDEVQQHTQEAIQMKLDGLRAEGLPPPAASATVAYVEVTTTA